MERKKAERGLLAEKKREAQRRRVNQPSRADDGERLVGDCARTTPGRRKRPTRSRQSAQLHDARCCARPLLPLHAHAIALQSSCHHERLPPRPRRAPAAPVHARLHRHTHLDTTPAPRPAPPAVDGPWARQHVCPVSPAAGVQSRRPGKGEGPGPRLAAKPPPRRRRRDLASNRLALFRPAQHTPPPFASRLQRPGPCCPRLPRLWQRVQFAQPRAQP